MQVSLGCTPAVCKHHLWTHTRRRLRLSRLRLRLWQLTQPPSSVTSIPAQLIRILGGVQQVVGRGPGHPSATEKPCSECSSSQGKTVVLAAESRTSNGAHAPLSTLQRSNPVPSGAGAPPERIWSAQQLPCSPWECPQPPTQSQLTAQC
jgi:hypothetical protein